jgi:hypothetical protein
MTLGLHEAAAPCPGPLADFAPLTMSDLGPCRATAHGGDTDADLCPNGWPGPSPGLRSSGHAAVERGRGAHQARSAAQPTAQRPAAQHAVHRPAPLPSPSHPGELCITCARTAAVAEPDAAGPGTYPCGAGCAPGAMPAAAAAIARAETPVAPSSGSLYRAPCCMSHSNAGWPSSPLCAVREAWLRQRGAQAAARSPCCTALQAPLRPLRPPFTTRPVSQVSAHHAPLDRQEYRCDVIVVSEVYQCCGVRLGQPPQQLLQHARVAALGRQVNRRPGSGAASMAAPSTAGGQARCTPPCAAAACRAAVRTATHLHPRAQVFNPPAGAVREVHVHPKVHQRFGCAAAGGGGGGAGWRAQPHGVTSARAVRWPWAGGCFQPCSRCHGTHTQQAFTPNHAPHLFLGAPSPQPSAAWPRVRGGGKHGQAVPAEAWQQHCRSHLLPRRRPKASAPAPRAPRQTPRARTSAVRMRRSRAFTSKSIVRSIARTHHAVLPCSAASWNVLGAASARSSSSYTANRLPSARRRGGAGLSGRAPASGQARAAEVHGTDASARDGCKCSLRAQLTQRQWRVQGRGRTRRRRQQRQLPRCVVRPRHGAGPGHTGLRRL